MIKKINNVKELNMIRILKKDKEIKLISISDNEIIIRIE